MESETCGWCTRTRGVGDPYYCCKEHELLDRMSISAHVADVEEEKTRGMRDGGTTMERVPLATMIERMLPFWNHNYTLLGECVGVSAATLHKLRKDPHARVTTTTYRAIVAAYRTGFSLETFPADAPAEPVQRQCSACGVTKDLVTGFYREKSLHGYGRMCRECRQAQRKRNAAARTYGSTDANYEAAIAYARSVAFSVSGYVTSASQQTRGAEPHSVESERVEAPV